MKSLEREVLLGFWKVHILHHAETRPVYGQWVLEELRRHGYFLSPGTLYPILRRMERHGWLRALTKPDAGSRDRRDYRLTSTGREVLSLVRAQVRELYDEVVAGTEASKAAHRRTAAHRSARTRNPGKLASPAIATLQL